MPVEKYTAYSILKHEYCKDYKLFLAYFYLHVVIFNIIHVAYFDTCLFVCILSMVMYFVLNLIEKPT